MEPFSQSIDYNSAALSLPEREVYTARIKELQALNTHRTMNQDDIQWLRDFAYNEAMERRMRYWGNFFTQKGLRETDLRTRK